MAMSSTERSSLLLREKANETEAEKVVDPVVEEEEKEEKVGVSCTDGLVPGSCTCLVQC